MREPPRRRWAITFTETKITAAETRLRIASMRREAARSFMIASRSIRFLEIDDDRVRVEKERDRREEEDGVAEIDDAADDRVEMGEEAEAGDRVEERLRRPAAEHAQHDLRAAHGEEEADRGGHHEGDHLVLGECGEAGADG